MLKDKLRIDLERFSKSIEKETNEISRNSWGEQFQAVFSDTLEKTINLTSDGKVFLITGDIPAMWLRDSTAQAYPYLSIAKSNSSFQTLLGDLVTSQCKYILIDQYANAFNETDNSNGHQDDHTDMNPWIWERKYEVDSLCYPIQMAYKLYKQTTYSKHFDKTFLDAAKMIVETFKQEQHHDLSTYRFERSTDRAEDTLPVNGKGTPVAYTGMTWSGFRPSDDACTYGYLIPANMFATVILGYLVEVLELFYDEAVFIDKVNLLRKEIKEGIEKYGTVKHPKTGQFVYAYEVDGYGNYLLMDDANVPSLLSAPYIGYCEKDEPTYLATRELILSTENPYFFSGKFGAGIGSAHTPKNYVWPIALSIQGLTSTSIEEKKSLLDLLVKTTDGTKQCHESFYINNPSLYTRKWFSWSNMMFCQLIINFLDIDSKYILKGVDSHE
ncbi:glycoside hydrolase family 125 protein [Dellaglioa sp. BT-FLS60]